RIRKLNDLGIIQIPLDLAADHNNLEVVPLVDGQGLIGGGQNGSRTSYPSDELHLSRSRRGSVQSEPIVVAVVLRPEHDAGISAIGVGPDLGLCRVVPPGRLSCNDRRIAAGRVQYGALNGVSTGKDAPIRGDGPAGKVVLEQNLTAI